MKSHTIQGRAHLCLSRRLCWAITFLFVLLLLAGASVALAEEGFVEKHENGTVDWLTGTVRAKGIGAPPANAVNAAQARAMALRAATVIARRNLLELLRGVQIDSATTVQNYLVNDDTVVSRVNGHLDRAIIEDTAYMSDGSVEVVAKVELRGPVSRTLLPGAAATPPTPPKPPKQKPGPTALQKTEQKPASRPAIPDGGSVAAAPSVATSIAPTMDGASGLIIDARGLGARPAMSPRIVDENGEEVYGSAFVGREYAIQQGMAGYAKDVEQAAASDRVGSAPLQVKAKAVTGQAGTDLVVSNETAAQIRAAAAGSDMLEQCRVMIVLD